MGFLPYFLPVGMSRNRYSFGLKARMRRKERRIARIDWHENVSSAPPLQGVRRRALYHVS
jgi:hypothetical protein